LVACQATFAYFFFDALTDNFVNVFPVLDSVGQYRLNDGFQSTGNSVNQVIALFLAEDFIEQNVGLDEVAVIFTQGVGRTNQFAIGFPGHIYCAFFIRPGVTNHVWYIWTTGTSVLEPHVAFEVVSVVLVDWTVDWRLLEVDADAVALSICIGEVAA